VTFQKSIFMFSLLCLIILPFSASANTSVINNSKPQKAPVVVELEEIWRVGGENDEHIFGLMIDARCDSEGNVYLLDHQLSQVTVVSPEGEYIQELGGEGDGPGECRTPQTITMMPDGTIGLGQRFPGKFIKVTKDGLPAGSMLVGGNQPEQTGFTMLLSGRNRGGTMLACTLHQVPMENGQTRDSHLMRLSETGKILANFGKHSTVLDFGKPHFVEKEMVAPFVAAHTVGANGKVYFTPERNEYQIAVFNADGTADKTISRKFDNPRRDKKTMDRMNSLFEEQDRALPFPITWEVEKVDQAVAELVGLPDGKLLVAHARSSLDLQPGVFMNYDVFNEDGQWSHELHVRCVANSDDDGLVFLDDGRVLLVKGLQMARLTASGNGGSVGDEENELITIEIICCRIKPMG